MTLMLAKPFFYSPNKNMIMLTVAYDPPPLLHHPNILLLFELHLDLYDQPEPPGPGVIISSNPARQNFFDLSETYLDQQTLVLEQRPRLSLQTRPRPSPRGLFSLGFCCRVGNYRAHKDRLWSRRGLYEKCQVGCFFLSDWQSAHAKRHHSTCWQSCEKHTSKVGSHTAAYSQEFPVCHFFFVSGCVQSL